MAFHYLRSTVQYCQARSAWTVTIRWTGRCDKESTDLFSSMSRDNMTWVISRKIKDRRGPPGFWNLSESIVYLKRTDWAIAQKRGCKALHRGNHSSRFAVLGGQLTCIAYIHSFIQNRTLSPMRWSQIEQISQSHVKQAYSPKWVKSWLSDLH